MAAAVIRVRDRDDGTLDMDIIFNPDIDNNSLAHRIVQSFVEYLNTPEVKASTTEKPQESLVISA